MRFLKQGICLALVGGGLAVAPVFQAQAAPAPTGDSLVQTMKDEAQGAVRVSKESATGKVGFIRVRGNGDLMPSKAARSNSAAAADKATDYLARYGAAFGARRGELKQLEVTKNKFGWTVRFGQRYKGIPVFGSQINANVDTQGDLTAVNGYAAPDLNLSVKPRLSSSAASSRAIRAVKADPTGSDDSGAVDTSGLKSSTELAIYRTGAIRGDVGTAALAYVVEVGNDANIRDMVFVDAQTGKLLNRYSMIHSALDRRLYEVQRAPANLIWTEGDAFPGSLDQWQAEEVAAAGDAYWFFANAFGRDSFDGAGRIMETVNNDPNISCPNANWNGVTANYCTGTATDDVVVHEWGHAYTEYTHGLIYQWQPGALNESYSDIWGETVDLINGRNDAEEGDIDAVRPVGQCSTHSPAKPIVTINAPAAIAKDCDAGAASFGPPLTGTGITGDVKLAEDDDATDGGTTNACTPIVNDLTGMIALVRSVIAFSNAQDAGATAVLVADNVEASPGGMSGADDTITIPSVRIRLSDGNLIKSQLGSATVNVTMKDAAGNRVDSYRWLEGEDADALNGAIRDMWAPTCYGDPGKVSDAEYYCASDDSGGVHSNSGVPNHGYALLVDGGTYNGVSVTGIGLDKAANIYYRAMVSYQTPTSDFGDHADSLLASCADLTGQDINALSTTPNTETLAASITADDCAQVASMVQAVELRKEPVQCNFQPLLDKNTPSLCGEGFTDQTVWSEDFEDGLAGWGVAAATTYPGSATAPWTAGSAPGGRTGTVAFGPTPDRGTCMADSTSFATRDSIISPTVTMPAATGQTPKLSFDHYVSTEIGYDGGNVKISINGGAYTVIPGSAYVFNAPGQLATAAEFSDNPMAGEEGFTGADGGEVTGSWGTSIVDLSLAGAAAGDQVRFRFDIGRDGCFGTDGWYVDDVTVTTCDEVVTPPPSKAWTKTKAKAKPKKVKFRKNFWAIIKVKSTTDNVSGKVKVVKRGKTLAKGKVKDGKAKLKIRKNLRVGKHTLVAKFLGSDTLLRSKDSFKVRVVRHRRR